MSVWMPLFQTKFKHVRDRYCIHFLLWACERCFKLQQSPPAIPTRVGTKIFWRTVRSIRNKQNFKFSRNLHDNNNKILKILCAKDYEKAISSL